MFPMQQNKPESALQNRQVIKQFLHHYIAMNLYRLRLETTNPCLSLLCLADTTLFSKYVPQKEKEKMVISLLNVVITLLYSTYFL